MKTFFIISFVILGALAPIASVLDGANTLTQGAPVMLVCWCVAAMVAVIN